MRIGGGEFIVRNKGIHGCVIMPHVLVMSVYLGGGGKYGTKLSEQTDACHAGGTTLHSGELLFATTLERESCVQASKKCLETLPQPSSGYCAGRHESAVVKTHKVSTRQFHGGRGRCRIHGERFSRVSRVGYFLHIGNFGKSFS